jgi:dihydroorotate dehydrogenase electron transfer subunit
MLMPIQCLATIIKKERLTDGIIAFGLKADDIVARAVPGQFLHIRCGEAHLLRRPISICDVHEGVLTIVVETRGEGTEWLAGRQAGDALDILGPLGSGFDISGSSLILVGGGIGVPPMLFAARRAAGNAAALLGFRNKDGVILEDKFKGICKDVVVATDNGSYGESGTVAPQLERLLQSGGYDAVLACGPKAMLKAVAELCDAFDVPCQVSMEERMGCGIGACLVCACKTVKDGKEEMRHVCKDGPVFKASEVVW